MYFQIYPSQGQWRWRLRAGNHEIIASGEAYHNYGDCLHAVNLVQSSANANIVVSK